MKNKNDIDSNIHLSDIIDLEEFQKLLDQFYEITKIGAAIVDLQGRVLVAVGWQDICIKFHRKNPITLKNCIESDIHLSRPGKQGEFKVYKCKNNLWDISSPIMIGDKLAGNIFLGQFFFEDDEVDIEVFRKQAKDYGFDEKEYLTALEKIPRWSREKVHKAMSFYSKLAIILSDLGNKNINLKNTINERDKLIGLLKDSESKLKIYFENAPEGIFITDYNGILIEANKASCDITGWKKEELIGKHILMFVPRSEHDNVKRHIELLRNKGKAYLELEFRHKGGSRRYWRVDAVRISNDLFVGFTKDITEKKLAEKRIEKLADDYGKVFNGLQDAMFLIRVTKKREFRFIRVNDAFQKKTGKTIMDIAGKTPGDLFPEDYYKDIFYENLERCLNIMESCSFEEQINNNFWFTTLNPVIETGNVNYIIGSSIDITANKEAEMSLKKQLSFERLIADISSSFINANPDNLYKIIINMLKKTCEFFCVDRGYIYKFIDNGKYMKKTYEWSFDGKSPDLMKSKYLKDFPWWSEQIRLNNYIYIRDTGELSKKAKAEKKIFQEQGIKSLLNILIKKKDSVIGFLGFDSILDHKIWTEDQINLMSVIANTVFDALSKNQMEMDLIRSRETAVKANKAKSDFIANISHEIRTPLNGIIGFTDLLMNSDLSEDQRTFTENVNMSARSLLDILNDILDFSRIEAGKLILEEEWTDIIKLMENAVDIIKHSADEKGIELLLNIKPETPNLILVDRIRLKQVLVNLLNNAVKFTDEGEVELKVYPQIMETEDKIRLSFFIRDTGIGISDKDKKNIFKGFEQLDTSTARRYGGIGLGLSISSNILGKMGSSINLSSSKNKGSVFSFSIERPFKEKFLSVSDFSNYFSKIMIIDDNPSNISILQNYLNYLKISCESFTDPFEAIERIKNKNIYDLIFIDLNMHKMNGIEVASIIKDELKKAKIQSSVVLMHFFKEAQEFDRNFKQLGIDLKLDKPIKYINLYDLLHKFIEGDDEKIMLESRSSRKAVSITNMSSDPYKILIVEDSIMNLLLLKNMIANLLPESIIIEAKDGPEAISLYKTNNPDLIFLDIQMPEMDGYTVSNQIRKLEENSILTPIIAVTARSAFGEREKCLDSGMDDYILKPITSEILIPVIKKYLIDREKPDPHFDKTGLLKSLSGNKKLFKRMIDESRKAIPEYVEEISDALIKNDIKLIREKAHKIKGAALTMNFFILSDIAKTIEKDNTLDMESIKVLIEKMKEEIVNIITKLDSLL